MPASVHAALLAFLVGLGQGMLHALGPDHCAALATLGASGGTRRSLKLAVSFAWGHALVLGTLAGLCLVFGVGVSEVFERWAERLGGLVLLGLAVAAILFPGTVRHGHPQFPPHGDDHAHHGHPHGTLNVSGVAGALMALSGVRALLLALPPLLVGGALSMSAWAYLPGFAAGVFGAMAVVSLLVSAGTRRLPERTAERLQRAVALTSGALGVIWIALA